MTGGIPIEPPRSLGAESAADAGEIHSSGGAFRLAVAVFTENRLALVGLFVVAFFILFCFVGPVLYHTNQVQTRLGIENEGPSLHHPLGTDTVGYDLLGRLMVGGQTTLVVGLVVSLLATSMGVAWGAIAGFAGGLVDGVMMRAVDALLAIPTLFLLLFLSSIFSPSEPLLIVVIASVAWLVPSRLVRAETLSLKTRNFVEAAQGQGAGPLRIIFRHVIPNVFGTVAVNSTFQVADAVLAVTSLSFLGLGIPPPAANWGGMLSDGVNYVYSGYWWQIWPAGVCIVLVVVAFNFIGDGLRDAFEVRLQRR
ncbi:MAG TPA: ABC transporter permease [Candidatus Dormibacteraeota bacterium]|nr:ABC transporter permease [Candidatus Dormibacteraeota bacterium]